MTSFIEAAKLKGLIVVAVMFVMILVMIAVAAAVMTFAVVLFVVRVAVFVMLAPMLVPSEVLAVVVMAVRTGRPTERRYHCHRHRYAGDFRHSILLPGAAAANRCPPQRGFGFEAQRMPSAVQPTEAALFGLSATGIQAGQAGTERKGATP